MSLHPIFEALLAPFAPKRPVIITSHIFPPIPDRRFDWSAHRDGEEEAGNYGYGRTKEEAIADLLEIERDE